MVCAEINDHSQIPSDVKLKVLFSMIQELNPALDIRNTGKFIKMKRVFQSSLAKAMLQYTKMRPSITP